MSDDFSHLPPEMARVCRALQNLSDCAGNFSVDLVFFSELRENDMALNEALEALAAARQYRGITARNAAWAWLWEQLKPRPGDDPATVEMSLDGIRRVADALTDKQQEQSNADTPQGPMG